MGQRHVRVRLLRTKRVWIAIDRRHRQILDFRDVSELRCVSIDGRSVPLHLDGDHIGDVTEAVFGILPGALRVVA